MRTRLMTVMVTLAILTTAACGNDDGTVSEALLAYISRQAKS